MSRKLITVLLVAMLAISLVFTGCATNQAPSEPSGEKKDDKKETKVGFVYVGPIGDGGWTFAHDQGRLAIEKELGVKTTYKDSVSDQNNDCVQVIKQMIDEGYNVIFGTSYGYGSHMAKLAKEYPDVKFLHCSGEYNGVNLTNYFGKIEQPRYLSGIAAGMKTKSKTIGYVAAFEIPEVIRGINAFTQGVRSVNPDAKVVVKWTHTWYDPAKEKDAAIALLAEGADVIAQHQDTTGPQIAAQEKGAFAIGYNTDSKAAAPKAYITAPIWNWGPYYVKQVKAVMDGTWKSENYWGGMKDGIVALAPLTEVAPEGAKAKIDEVQKKIVDGSFDVFAGPIKDQAGTVKVKEGEALSGEAQLSCDWFVEGVVGKIEKQ